MNVSGVVKKPCKTTRRWHGLIILLLDTVSVTFLVFDLNIGDWERRFGKLIGKNSDCVHCCGAC